MSTIPKKQSKKMVSMPLINPNAAGIDIGDRLIAVGVPPGRDEVQVREFGAFTCDLKEISAWLKKCGIDSVAMESTGIYWKNLFSVLNRDGFEVYLVNSKHVKNVTGKKTDTSDAQWIQHLHSCGLLKSSFLADDQTEAIRTLVRFRRSLTEESTRHILRMQKALELMNIKVHTVISDITGKTGTAIVEAIIAGVRECDQFLPLVDGRIKADKETIRKSLEANWRQEHLLMLRMSFGMYKEVQNQIIELEKEIEQLLKEYAAFQNEGEINEVVQKEKKKVNKKAKNAPVFNTRSYLHQIHKVDVTEIFGISEIGALELFSETGTDLSKFESARHYVSWLNLCPNNKISGGKLISSSRLKKKPNASSQAFRSAANSLNRSAHWLGDYFRRMRAKGGTKYAIVATARKLAIIYYNMVRYKHPFSPVDVDQYQEKRKKAKIAYLERTLDRLKQEAA